MRATIVEQETKDSGLLVNGGVEMEGYNCHIRLSNGEEIVIEDVNPEVIKSMVGWELVTAAGRLIAIKPQTINEQFKNGPINATIGLAKDYPNSHHLPELMFS